MQSSWQPAQTRRPNPRRTSFDTSIGPGTTHGAGHWANVCTCLPPGRGYDRCSCPNRNPPHYRPHRGRSGHNTASGRHAHATSHDVCHSGTAADRECHPCSGAQPHRNDGGCATADTHTHGYSQPKQPAHQPPLQPAATWSGIAVGHKLRCSPYEADDYRYSPSVEPRIADAQGGIYGPHTGTWFDTIRDTGIEHMVTRAEAHDSGLCAASPETRSVFASDLLNLTLASPTVNRHLKVDKDAAEWLPSLNRCWYADRIIQVRLECGLTIDTEEADAIGAVLGGCGSTAMVVVPRDTTETPLAAAAATPTPTPAQKPDAHALYDDNGNGRITCAEARAHAVAPVPRGHHAYEYMRDADGYGVV